jgi:hypothetical protein
VCTKTKWGMQWRAWFGLVPHRLSVKRPNACFHVQCMYNMRLALWLAARCACAPPPAALNSLNPKYAPGLSPGLPGPWRPVWGAFYPISAIPTADRSIICSACDVWVGVRNNNVLIGVHINNRSVLYQFPRLVNAASGPVLDNHSGPRANITPWY